MSIIAFIIILFAFCGCYASYAKYHSALHPIFLYNALWLILTIVLQINTMEWYPLGNDVYTVLLQMVVFTCDGTSGHCLGSANPYM